jgi:hypothetical protein
VQIALPPGGASTGCSTELNRRPHDDSIERLQTSSALALQVVYDSAAVEGRSETASCFRGDGNAMGFMGMVGRDKRLARPEAHGHNHLNVRYKVAPDMSEVEVDI